MILAFSLFGITLNSNAQNSNKDNFEVKVDGLGCPFCAYGLEKKFKELKGIKDVKIEMETGIMNFTFPTDKGLSIEKVESQVEEAGYTPVSVVITRGNGKTETSEREVLEEVAEEAIVESAFFVAGNCGMCKARIEKAAKDVSGVLDANWNKETKDLIVSFDGSKVSQEEIENAVAKSGHDTNIATADDDIYDKLPGCCQYR